ncbi:MAG: DUF4031 domain-containing protein [Oryzihumus sp.]
MAIWIDPPRWPAHGRLWSHLISDTSYGELHDFAAAHGIPRRGFEGDHYDVSEERYAALVAAGARPVAGTELARRLRDSGLRFPKRKGEWPLARHHDVITTLDLPHRLDVVASRLPPPEEQTAASAVFVLDALGDFLLVHSVVRDAWGAPAGGREPGESVRAGAVREVREESGLVIEEQGLRHCGYERVTIDGDASAHRWPHRRNYVACFTYQLETVRPDVEPQLDDVDAAEWVDEVELERRCAGEFWWPMVQRRDLWP